MLILHSYINKNGFVDNIEENEAERKRDEIADAVSFFNQVLKHCGPYV